MFVNASDTSFSIFYRFSILSALSEARVTMLENFNDADCHNVRRLRTGDVKLLATKIKVLVR